MNKNLTNRLNHLKSITELDPVIQEYYRRINKHRDLVYKLCKKLGIPEIGRLHDLDKYSPKISKPYAYHWIAKDRSIEPEYNKVKNLHIKTNKHHPEYWYDKLEDMDFNSFLEMVADSIASGMLNNKNYRPRDTYRYYIENNKNKFVPIPNIKKAWEEFLIKYGNYGDKYLDRDKIKEIYDKHVKGLLGEGDKGGLVDLSK